MICPDTVVLLLWLPLLTTGGANVVGGSIYTLFEVTLMPWLSVVSVGSATICMCSLIGSLVMWYKGASGQQSWSWEQAECCPSFMLISG